MYPPKEQYTRMQKWLQRLVGQFQAQGEIWLVGDRNADYLKVGDNTYYNRGRKVGLHK